jgi:hypothetical protein
MAGTPSPAMERARQAASATDRTLVWRASLRLRALEPEEVAPALHRRAEAVGGYAHRGTTTADRATLLLRVPPDELERFLDSASELGSVQERSVSFDDVSTDVIDLDTRLTNLTAVRDRLQEHLGRSANVSEIIEVERVRGPVGLVATGIGRALSWLVFIR